MLIYKINVMPKSENYWNRKNPTIFLLRLIRSIGPIVKFHG
jgi:hypothetical protein